MRKAKCRMFWQKTGILLFLLLYNCAVYQGARVFTQGRVHEYLGFDFECNVPLIPFMVYIYLGCFLFWAFNYILSVQNGKDGDKDRVKIFVISNIVARMFCFLIFLIFPTTIERPEIVGSGLSRNLLRLVYMVDAPDNLFPSLHCLNSWFCFIGVRGRKVIPIWYQILSCLLALLVCVSTLTVKQHVLVDAVAGVLLADESTFWSKDWEVLFYSHLKITWIRKRVFFWSFTEVLG